MDVKKKAKPEASPAFKRRQTMHAPAHLLHHQKDDFEEEDSEIIAKRFDLVKHLNMD